MGAPPVFRRIALPASHDATPGNIAVPAPGSAFANDSLDLSVCDREPIHVPGSIQPRGLLLIADPDTLEVRAGAGDIEGRLTPAWIGRPLDLLLAQDLASPLAAATASGAPVPLAPVPGRVGAFDVTLHRSEGHLIVELEPEDGAPAGAAAVLAELDAAGTSFERAGDLQSLCERAAAVFRRLTGFDRVMIYRFLDDSGGVVLAEDRDAALPSFLNHHFPAGDIPKQARALYVRNRVRVISDVSYTPAPLRPPGAGLGGIDLGDAALRSVSPIHLQYMRNMGIAASASISIVKDGVLWGLVACHHRSPRSLSYVTRAACATLAGGLARQIRAKEEAELYRDRIRLRGAEDMILARMNQEDSFETILAELAEELRRMLAADGFAAVRGRRIITAGACPGADELAELARWLGPRAMREPFASYALGERLPAAARFAALASGTLAVTLPGESSTLLIWLRAEERQVVEWAGNPHKAAGGAPGDTLSPRTSFDAWREEVGGRARPWSLAEIEAAGRLRRRLFETRQARRLRDLNRELGTIVADKESLIQQKDYLLREVNHRVQNSLQLVQSFLALQARDGDAALKDQLGEAQRRISAVALVHRRLYQADELETIDLGRYLEELVGEMMGAIGDGWARSLSLDLAPMLVAADRAINIGLVLTELVINANKYAYGGAPGPIDICLEQHGQRLRLIVADRGGGKIRKHEGFGTRMIDAMVQRLGGTLERLPNDPGLRVILTAPIA